MGQRCSRDLQRWVWPSAVVAVRNLRTVASGSCRACSTGTKNALSMASAMYPCPVVTAYYAVHSCSIALRGHVVLVLCWPLPAVVVRWCRQGVIKGSKCKWGGIYLFQHKGCYFVQGKKTGNWKPQLLPPRLLSALLAINSDPNSSKFPLMTFFGKEQDLCGESREGLTIFQNKAGLCLSVLFQSQQSLHSSSFKTYNSFYHTQWNSFEVSQC